MLHPFVPFVTEDLWKLLGNNKMLISSDWPESKDSLKFPNQVAEINKLKQTITAVRSVMADFDIARNSHITIQHKSLKTITDNQDAIKYMAKIEKLEFEVTFDNKTKTISQVVTPEITVLLHLDQNIDIEAEKEKMQNEITNLKKFIIGMEKKLSNKSYTDNAPEHIVQETKENLKASQQKLAKISTRFKAIS